VAIAGDTGGAIKGKIIDLHFSTVQQAVSWGRRTVTVKILN
jgi:cystine transport system substrate-binding protein